MNMRVLWIKYLCTNVHCIVRVVLWSRCLLPRPMMSPWRAPSPWCLAVFFLRFSKEMLVEESTSRTEPGVGAPGNHSQGLRSGTRCDRGILDWHRGCSWGPSPIGSMLRRHIELAWGERSTLSMNYMQRTSNDPRSGLSRSLMPAFEMCPSMHACSEVYHRYVLACPLQKVIYISGKSGIILQQLSLQNIYVVLLTGLQIYY